ncbi:MAG TPA: restriction endonuclease, partial [Bryobacteraceae bacterium]
MAQQSNQDARNAPEELTLEAPDRFQAQAAARLIAMAESELQASIIEPLLRRMGFRQVRDSSGPREEGKDLVAIKVDEFGRSLLYAIQIKKWKLSAKAESWDSFGLLLNQLEMALEERTLDPSTNEERKPDHCIFITPYPIHERVWLAFGCGHAHRNSADAGHGRQLRGQLYPTITPDGHCDSAHRRHRDSQPTELH